MPEKLLMSFFTRENPRGDSWVYEGWGPIRREVSPGRMMPNPDTVLETLEVPFEKSNIEVVSRLSSLEGGQKWLESCEKYLKGWGKGMLKEFPFEITPLEMPERFLYVFEKGPYKFGDKSFPIQTLKSVPEGMTLGRFVPELRDVPYCPIDGEKIGMMSNGGVLSKSGERHGYTMQEDIGLIYLTSPIDASLLGDLKENDVIDPFYDYPLTHFMEYIFARHCPDKEDNPCPAIRIELNPKKPEDATIAREKRWDEARSDRGRGFAPYFPWQAKASKK